ncbi:hypothetical protein GCM10009860_11490 [Microbacterium mitrae]|uniref:Phage major capsid protein n=1 Tax=Microbacterium mitrae TaxID=664640 RepID=A0A5C8HQS3_9MICO|nr:phage major capsid protein [Microbacterium mitrae]TXK06466.1 phage major capsid protein [Microbacterium mitrae]
MDYKSIMARELKAARDISLKYGERDIVGDDLVAVNNHLKAYKEAKAASERGDAEKLRASQELIDNLAAIGFDTGLNVSTPAKSGIARKQSARGQRWAEKAVSGVQGMSSRLGVVDGVKALVSGSISVPDLVGEPVEILAKRTTLLDLVGRGKPQGERVGNGFQYIRQTARTNNAAAVPDGEAKPTSVYTFGEVDDKYRVYANKTEDLPYRYLNDYEAITDIVRTQLAEDTMQAIEADMLSGDGTGDAFTGILNTSGIQTQAWSTDLLRTLSNAKHKFVAQELPFTGWVLNPDDLQSLELMREGGATGPFLFPSRAAIEDFLGASVVTSVGMPAGTAVVGDWDQAEIIPIGDDELIVDAGKRTTDNTFLFMFEGRYGFRVSKPVAFVAVTLTEA